MIFMSRASEKILRQLQAYIAKKAPDGPASEEELQRLIAEFTEKYNASCGHLDDGVPPVVYDVYDYLDLASQARRKRDKRAYLAKAAALEPDNVDVKLEQIKVDAKSPLDFIEALPPLIEAEEKHLRDEEIYQSSKGEFWMVFETRPYMRLLFEYMTNLIDAGVTNKAIAVGEEMLRLCQTDNLGIRFILMPLYAQVCNEMKALRLCKRMHEENSAFYLLPLALLYYKLGNWPKAKDYLEKLKANYPDTKKFLRAVKRNDRYFFGQCSNPYGYAKGDTSELIVAYEDNLYVYSREPSFFEWADKALIVHRKKSEKQ